MSISDRGLALIKAHEGLRLTAYPDPATGGDPWTIGYGHTQGVTQGLTITEAQATDFLREDLYWVEQCIRDTVRVSLSQGQYDALCSLIFNIGAGAFTRSTLLRLLNDGNYAGAAAEFVRWNMAAGKPMPGLTKRRAQERALFLEATTPSPAPIPAPAAPIPAAPPPIHYAPAGEADAPEQQPEVHMAPFIAAALPALIDLVPKLGSLFGSGSAVADRNVKAAEIVVAAAKQAIGARNEQELVETVKADPAAAATVKQAVEARWLEITEAGGGGIEGARKSDAGFVASGEPVWRSPSFVMGCLLLPLVYLIVLNVIGVLGAAEWSAEARAGLAGTIVGTIVGGLVGYYYGQTTSRNRSNA